MIKEEKIKLERLLHSKQTIHKYFEEKYPTKTIEIKTKKQRKKMDEDTKLEKEKIQLNTKNPLFTKAMQKGICPFQRQDATVAAKKRNN